MWADDRLINLLGIELSIIQAPMAGSAFSDMVVAVSEAGGLGSLACALLSVEQARRELETIRRKTSRPINANFSCHQPPRDDRAREMSWRRRLDAYYVQLQVDGNTSIPSASRTPFDDKMDHLKPDEAYAQLLYGLTRRGYVTMRVEKNGEGRSGGPPCASEQSDLQLAVRRSLAGLNWLTKADFVDRDRIFIFAHSIGPLEGVLVAQRFSVRGFIAAETIGKSWFEHQLENARRQVLILGQPYDAADRFVRTLEKCQHRFSSRSKNPSKSSRTRPSVRML